MKKILINILLLLYGIYQSFAQTDSVFGTYQTIGSFTPTITLFPNNTFSYKSLIDVGDVPTTFGYLEFFGDTVVFKYREQIHPEIINTEFQFNPERKNILLKISSNKSTSYQEISLSFKDPITQNVKAYSFKSGVLEIDTILPTDSLILHFNYYSQILINLDIDNFNEYHFFVNLPTMPTMYYLTENKALIKNGLLYFSLTTDGVPYYNTNVFVKSKDVRKILNFISKKRKEEWENIRKKSKEN